MYAGELSFFFGGKCDVRVEWSLGCWGWIWEGRGVRYGLGIIVGFWRCLSNGGIETRGGGMRMGQVLWVLGRGRGCMGLMGAVCEVETVFVLLNWDNWLILCEIRITFKGRGAGVSGL